jgi:ABC-2 type transport system permease protein
VIQQSHAQQHSAVSVIAEVRKLAAFLRKDALIAWSYRRAMVSDIVSFLGEAALFYFLSFLVDPARMPQLGGTRADYMGFVAVGLTVAAFYQMGVAKMIGAVRNEQLMGTFEALLVTPTAPTTIQIGLVIYDLIRIPVRAGLFLVLADKVFGVDIHWAGLAQTIAITLVFLPFVWGVAAALAAVVVGFRQATAVVGFVNYALLLGSGTYFPMELLPSWLETTIRLNPLALALNGARAALLGGAGWETTLPQIAMILPLSILAWVAGTLGFRFALDRERRAGTLGLY